MSETKIEINDAELEEVAGGKKKNSKWEDIKSRHCPHCNGRLQKHKNNKLIICKDRGHYWEWNEIKAKDITFENMTGTNPAKLVM